MKKTSNKAKIGFILAISSAFLYGLSTPINKLLLLDINPFVLSGWSYLFSGIITLPSLRNKKSNKSLKKTDIPKLVMIILFGSLLGPIIFFFGLNLSTSFQASLFQYSEAIFTILIALIVFKEKISKMTWLGIFIILITLMLWSIDFNIFRINQIFGTGVILILIGCACWAIDNNTTQSLGEKSSFQITSIKCIFGGIISLLLAILLDINIVLNFEYFLVIFIVGIFTFGVSIICFTSALKYLGTISTVMIVSLSPLIAAFLSIFINMEMINFLDLIILFIVILGVYLLIKEKRSIMHFHTAMIHFHPITSETIHHENIRIIEENSNGILHEHWKISHSHTEPHDSEHEN